MAKNLNKRMGDNTARLGEVRFSYAHVFERYDSNGDESKAKYSVCVLIPKENKETVAMLESIINAAKEKGKVTKWGGKIPGKLTLPLRDGDEEDKGGVYEGMYFFNCSADRQPEVKVLENGRLTDALDDGDFYSGCYGAITVAAFPYDANGNKGVGLGLNNLVKTRDGERLAGGSSAKDDFADLEDDLLD